MFFGLNFTHQRSIFLPHLLLATIWLMGGTATGLWTCSKGIVSRFTRYLQEPVFMYILLKMKTVSVCLMLTVWPCAECHHSESWIHTGTALILKPKLLYIKLSSSWFISAVINICLQWMKTRKNTVCRIINKWFSSRFNVFFLALLWPMSGFYNLKSHLDRDLFHSSIEIPLGLWFIA